MSEDEDFDESGPNPDPSFLAYLDLEPEFQDEGLRATLILLWVQSRGSFPTPGQINKDLHNGFKFIREGAWATETT